MNKVGKEVLTIKDVSAYICEECGEAYYTTDISEKIDKIMKKLIEKMKTSMLPLYNYRGLIWTLSGEISPQNT